MGKLRWQVVCLAMVSFTIITLNSSNALALESEVPKTGQTRSFASGDDGDLQIGIPWPVPRFTPNGDGTVTDNLTHLMWTENTQQIYGEMNWGDAVGACNNLDFAFYTDWYLPNVKELHSLIDWGERNPALPSDHPFTYVYLDIYWSSTGRANVPSSAWYVDLDWGGVGYHNMTADTPRVWCVRSGSGPCDVFVPGPDWCRDCGPCSEGQGDCDSDAECQSGLICAKDVGADYGWPANRDVCEPP